MKGAGEQIVHDLRVALYDHLQRLSLSFHDTQKKGNLVTRVTGDVNSVGQLFSESLGEIVSAVLLLIGMAIVSVIVDPVLALAVLGVSPVLFFVTSRYKGRLKDLARRQRAEEGEIASLADESLSAMQVVKAFGSERFERDRVERRSESRLAIGVLLSRHGSALQRAHRRPGRGRHRSRSDRRRHEGGGRADYSWRSRRLHFVRVQDLQTSARHRPPTRKSIAKPRPCRPRRRDPRNRYATRGPPRRVTAASALAGDVELSEASFSYADGRPALLDISLQIPQGSRIAIVGSSGAGKSTLGALIARFYDPTSGTVSIDGRDAATARCRGCAIRWASCSRTRFSSAEPWPRTSRTRPMPRSPR